MHLSDNTYISDFKLQGNKLIHLECRFLILLIYDITNPNSKTENYICIQRSFCNVNINNASSGLRENVILTNLGPKIGGKNMTPKCRMGGEIRGRHF